MGKAIRRYLKDAFYADQAMALLRRIVQARGGAIRREHGEALHDWRVVGRRLVEFTRLWASRPLRRQVLPLAKGWIKATNAARDAEVELGLIAELKREAKPEWAEALAALEAEYAPRLREESERLAAYLADAERDGEERRLEEILGAQPRFARVPERLPRRLRRAIGEFVMLSERDHEDLESLHGWRLAAKRLRYGFEPLAALDAELKAALGELTAVQRALGEHRDWMRLAEKCRELDAAPRAMIEELEARAEASMGKRPSRIDAIHQLHGEGWAPPRLAPRALRRRLLKEYENDERGTVKEALALAAQTLKGRKRSDGSQALVRPLRAALSLAEEGGERSPETLAEALLAGSLMGDAPLSEDALAERFGATVTGVVLALDPGEEPAEEHRERLLAAPPQTRQIALALSLEELRFALEAGRPRRELRAALGRLRALLPLFQEPGGSPNGGSLLEQARKLAERCSDDD